MKNITTCMIMALLFSFSAFATETGSGDPNNVNPPGGTPGVKGFDCDGVCERYLSGSGILKKREYQHLLDFGDLNTQGTSQSTDGKKPTDAAE